MVLDCISKRQETRELLTELTDLRKIGVVSKRAAPYVLLDGKRPPHQLSFWEPGVQLAPKGPAAPGDRLRYTLRLRTTDSAFSNVRIRDDLGALNATAVFAPGSLSLVSVPAGASTANTNPNGGTNGAGLLDISGLDVAADSEIQLQFDITLAEPLLDGLVVLNQADLIENGAQIADSDDPNVNGRADPEVAGDEDPTELVIDSAPQLLVEKVSTYLDGDPSVLLAGERLRYTITVQNAGSDNATNVYMTDMVPANTTYVADSATLNGAPVADGPNGSPLIEGILLGDFAVAGPAVTVEFDVTVYPDVPNGTIISNQAFVTAADQGVTDVPSDDPRTEVEDDPTRDVVGNYPLLFAEKSAALQVDGDSPGIVDPGIFVTMWFQWNPVGKNPIGVITGIAQDLRQRDQIGIEIVLTLGV